MRRAQAWVDYDRQMQQYRQQLAEWEERNGSASAQRADVAVEMTRLRARAETLSNEIEAEYFRRKDKVQALVTDMLAGRSLARGSDNPDGILDVDPDRIVQARFYVATYVTDRGEESAPSPVSDMVEIDQNDSVTVTVAAPPAGRHVVKWRLYRSNTGRAASSFQFVDEMLATTPRYTDTLKAAQLGEVCPTLTWAEPPFRVDSGSASPMKPPKGADPYLRGAVGMPNGIVAGFIDNFVAFCHPYHPYAWPVEYQITTEWPIVGLGVFGQTLFVGTAGAPYLISGSDSASMSAIKLPSQQACVSRRSIASVGNGVIYASPDGLCMATPAGVELLTGALFAREDWQALGPESIFGAVHEGVYYFWTARGCHALDFAARKLGTVDVQATAVCLDAVSDHLYVAEGGRIRKLFADGRRQGLWRSGRVVLPQHTPLAWVQADGDQSELTPLTVRWFGDGQLRHTATLTNTRPQRLPPGRWREHEIEVQGAARVTCVLLTSSTQELQGA